MKMDRLEDLKNKSLSELLEMVKEGVAPFLANLNSACLEESLQAAAEEMEIFSTAIREVIHGKRI